MQFIGTRRLSNMATLG
jgi:hypothetical protein